jgi:hypothetical protein
MICFGTALPFSTQTAKVSIGRLPAGKLCKSLFWFPYHIILENMGEKELQRIEDWVNNYPRKIFGYKSANEMAA